LRPVAVRWSPGRADERLGGVAPAVERKLGPRQLPYFVFGGDQRTKLLSEQCVPYEKFFPVDRLAAIEPFAVFEQRSLNPRIYWFGGFRLIGHRPTPDLS